LEAVTNRSTPSQKRRGRIAGHARASAADGNGRAADPRRESGIRVLGDMGWGSHVCVFYETKEDLLDTNATYFRAGLDSNESCVWAVSDPVTVDEATEFLRANVKQFDRHLAAGQIEILPAREWYLKGDQLDLKKITRGWSEKLQHALASGYDGLRVSGNAFWIETRHWQEFCQYERELDQSLAGQKMLVLCTYSLRASRAVDLLDVTRAHNFSVARRNGDWEFLETPELRAAKQEITKLRSGMDILSKPFPKRDLLTERERVVLAQIVRGASSKEAARILAVSHRTVEFHRANIMQKLGARNIVNLLQIVLGDNDDRRS
jgi:DNA-binding CsgD family transcriptional regulator